jgi:hypothetical protein
MVITDTKETEQNFINGLRDSIPSTLQRKLVIKVNKRKTDELVEEAVREASLLPQYAEPWIIFDRDKVQKFDQIISSAKEKGIHVGWSNPCIEIWFSAYFGEMPHFQDSVDCVKGFEKKFRQVTGQDYQKSDPEIYLKLCRFGNETQAFSVARQKEKEHQRIEKLKPSEMCPATTVYIFVEEIKSKIDHGTK